MCPIRLRVIVSVCRSPFACKHDGCVDTYDVQFDWNNSHGHLATLLIDRPSRGVVIDLGCGYAPHAEILRAERFTFVGLDVDVRAVSDLRSRGFTTAAVDLTESADIPTALTAVVAELASPEPVVAVVALDVVEHLVEPHETLAAVAIWMRDRGIDLFGASIPNVSYQDIAFKLLNARWDVTPTGLLDQTHLRFFTDGSLKALMVSLGLVEVARHDVIVPESDQFWPRDHPMLAPATSLGSALRQVRHLSDDHATTHQFVRLCSLDEDLPVAPRITAQRPDVALSRPLISVLIVPGADPSHARRSIAAQTDSRYEILDPPEGVDDVAALHEMVDRTSGDYLTLLDGVLEPTPAWIEQFADAAVAFPGAILRCSPAMSDGSEDGSNRATRSTSPNISCLMRRRPRRLQFLERHW